MKQQGMLYLLRKLGGVGPAATTLGNMQIDDEILYTSSEEDVLFIIKAADALL